METLYLTTGTVLAVLRTVLLVAAVAVGGAAALSWAVRTRRISPFSGVARLVRGRVDPLFAPVERRVVRAGGQPAHAPFWALAAVVVAGIVLLSLLGFVREETARVASALQAGPRGAWVVLVTWTFAVLRIALFARVISSWFRVSPYSPWIRWAFVLTEWMLAPLRRVIPTLGMVDVTPIVAYFGLSLLQGILT